MTVIKNAADRWNTLAKEQKISAVLLGVCGIVVLGFSMQRISASIRDPFTVSKDKFTQAREKVEAINPEQRELEASKRRDTDGDGISDFDEEKLIGTSPYLRDTDGDGMPDNAELALGKNPTCAEGTVCAGPALDLSLIATSSPFLSPAATMQDGGGFFAAFQRGINDKKRIVREQTGSTSTALEDTLIRDPAVIRKALLESGKVDKDTLDKITDDQLLKVYDQAALEAQQKQLQETTGLKEIPSGITSE